MKTYPVYLNGDPVITKDTIPVINPANGEVFARMSTVGRPAVAQAISDAHTAFRSWKHITGKGRGEWLRKIADELERRREEIARFITLENGKPVTQSQGEVAMAVDHLRWFAEEARRGYGRVIPPQNDCKRHFVLKSPVGVVAAISPWNLPLLLAVRKVAPALAAGCPVILKPSSRTPLCAAAFADCVDKVNPPKGVFQLVLGSSGELAKEFLENPLCRKITFTGSSEVGSSLIAGAAKTIKPLSLELGGHAPVLVFSDCDLEETVKDTLMAKFRNAGQTGIAPNRIFVQRPIYEDFLAALTELTRGMRVGDGMDPQTQIGPLIDKEAVARAVEHVQDAVQGGAKLMCGGKAIKGPGFFFQPTVLRNVSRQSLCMLEETFAPIAPITVFDKEAEAIQWANDSKFGLVAYVFTKDLNRTLRLAEALEAGTIAVNDGLPVSSNCPFGGLKQSGWGRELGGEGMETFLETKHVSIGID